MPAAPDRDELLSAFAKVISRRRVELGYSQEELAANAGLNRTYISGVERCRRNITARTVARLIGALHLRPNEFFKRVLQELE